MMNERIKELAEQAGFYFYDMHNVDGQDLGETIEADKWDTAIKFTELIVKECCDYLEQEIDRLCGYSNQLTELDKICEVDICILKCYDNIEGIKQHFGINYEHQ